MADPTVSSINPFANINLGSHLGSMGAILLVVLIAVVILGLGAMLIYWRVVKKQYWIKIHVFRLIGNIPTRVAIYSAKEVPFGFAGDKLWRVASSGWNKFKILKWLPVGKIQTAPREFWYYIRKDGEWINFQIGDLNEISEKAGVRFVQEDMRLQRLATERLLEQRLMNKSFWEKWGTTVMMVIVFLVIGVCMVIIFYQWGKLLDKMIPIIDTQAKSTALLVRYCGESYINATGGNMQGLIPT